MIYPQNYTIFDFETTGLDPKNSHITEVAALKVTDGREEKFHRLINWGVPIPAEITKLTGISQELIEAEGVYPKQAGQDFLVFIRNQFLIGHNIVKFDLPFLHYFLMRASVVADTVAIQNFMKQANSRCVDTAMEYKARKMKSERYWHESGFDFYNRIGEVRAYGIKYNVGICCDELGIDKSSGQHRAMADVLLTNEIYKKLCLNK